MIEIAPSDQEIGAIGRQDFIDAFKPVEHLLYPSTEPRFVFDSRNAHSRLTERQASFRLGLEIVRVCVAHGKDPAGAAVDLYEVTLTETLRGSMGYSLTIDQVHGVEVTGNQSNSYFFEVNRSDNPALSSSDSDAVLTDDAQTMADMLRSIATGETDVNAVVEATGEMAHEIAALAELRAKMGIPERDVLTNSQFVSILIKLSQCGPGNQIIPKPEA